MKFLILLLITFPVFACQIQVPTSEAQRYIEAMPNGVAPLYSCADKPEEKCHCVDDVIWDQVEIIDDEIKISGDKLTAKLNRENAIKAKQEAKKTAKEALKNIDIDGATTIAKLKVIVKALLEAQE